MTRARGWCGASKEVLAEVGVGFRASSVQSCYLDSHLVRELLPEAHEHREAAWQAQVTKAKNELVEMEKLKGKDKEKPVSGTLEFRIRLLSKVELHVVGGVALALLSLIHI